MTDDIHIDSNAILLKILDKTEKIGEDTATIKSALWPDPNQPGVLTEHGKRLKSLESWRSYLTGAWAVLSVGALGFIKHVFGKH